MKKTFRILIAVLSVSIGLYPLIYFFIDRKFGLLSSKEEALLTNVFWNIGFYCHILLGGIALLIGWSQFSRSLREKRLALHRLLGKIYVGSVLISALTGIYIGFYATGGVVSATGFICLGIFWFISTWMAYQYVRKGQIDPHREMMIYSYAACFAAVTLRIWLPILMIVFQNFTTAYLIVAWLCWVPNVLAAYWWVQRSRVKRMS